MKLKLLFLLTILLVAIEGNSQYLYPVNTEINNINQAEFLYENKLYNFCYEYLSLLNNSEFHFNNTINYTEQNIEKSWYYYISSGLKINNKNVIKYITPFISNQNFSKYYINKLYYNTGNYFFNKKDYSQALGFFTKVDIENSTQDEIFDTKFKMSYCYLLLNDFENAAKHFATLKNDTNANGIDANYYFGLLSLSRQNYDDALSSFQKIELSTKYRNIIPYFIAQSYYYKNDLKSCINYSLPRIQQNETQNKQELVSLVLQSYFQLNDFNSAIKFFEKEQRYNYTLTDKEKLNVGYSYYKANNIDSAISFFYSLMNINSIIGQNAAYYLADCYIQKNNISEAKNAFHMAKSTKFDTTITENSFFNYIKCQYASKNYDDVLLTSQSFQTEYPKSMHNNALNILKSKVYQITDKDIEGFKKMIDLEKVENPKIIQKLAYGAALKYFQSNNLDSALYLLNISKQYPEDINLYVQSYFWMGETYSRKRDWNNTLTEEKHFMQLSSQINKNLGSLTLKAMYNIAYANMMKMNIINAIDGFKNLLSSENNKNELKKINLLNDVNLKLADCYNANKSYIEAEAIYKNNVNYSDQEKKYALFQLAKIEGYKGDFDHKIAQLLQLLPQTEVDLNKEITFELAESYFLVENWTNAANYYNLLAQNKQYESLASFKSALCQENNKNLNGAIEGYKLVIQKFPKQPEKELALTQLENIYLNQNKLSELELYLKSINETNNESKFENLLYKQGESQYFSEDYKKARTSWMKYLKTYPNGVFKNETNNYLGIIEYNQKNYNESLKYFKSISPDSASEFYKSALDNIIEIYVSKFKDTTSSLTYLKSNTKLQNQKSALESNEILMRYFFNHYQASNYQEAYEYYASHTTENENNANKKLYQGHSELLKNNLTNAYQLYSIVEQLAQSPAYDEAIYYKNYCLMQQKKYSDAESNILKALNLSNVSDHWIYKYYLLLSDVFVLEKDNFNAKATLNSLIKNSKEKEIIIEAKVKLSQIK